MRIRLLKNYTPPGEGRLRFSGELLTVPDERGREMIAEGLAAEWEHPAKEQHPDVLLSEPDEHE